MWLTGRKINLSCEHIVLDLQSDSPRSLRISLRSLGDISIFKSSAGIRPSLVALLTSAPACTRALIAPTRPHRHAK